MSARIMGALAVGFVLATLGATTPAGAATASPQSRPGGDVAIARLVTHRTDKRDVPGYLRFALDTGSVVGVSASSAHRMNAVLDYRVAKVVAYATRVPQSPCTDGGPNCGMFLQHMKSQPCVAHTMCILQTVGSLPPGVNDSEDWVDSVAFDNRTGRVLRLANVLPAGRQAAFVDAVNSAVQAQLAAAGIDDPEIWGQPILLKDIHAWLPGSRGIDVWFAKYAVAPGSSGIVHVNIPWKLVRA